MVKFWDTVLLLPWWLMPEPGSEVFLLFLASYHTLDSCALCGQDLARMTIILSSSSVFRQPLARSLGTLTLTQIPLRYPLIRCNCMLWSLLVLT